MDAVRRRLCSKAEEWHVDDRNMHVTPDFYRTGREEVSPWTIAGLAEVIQDSGKAAVFGLDSGRIVHLPRFLHDR